MIFSIAAKYAVWSASRWVWNARYSESRSYAVDIGTSSAGATRTSTGKLMFQSDASITRRASRSAASPASRGTAYSISRNTTRRGAVNTRCATSL